MTKETRSLANGTVSECICRDCVSPGSGWRRHVKIATRRSIRHSEKRHIAASIDGQ